MKSAEKEMAACGRQQNLGNILHHTHFPSSIPFFKHESHHPTGCLGSVLSPEQAPWQTTVLLTNPSFSQAASAAAAHNRISTRPFSETNRVAAAAVAATATGILTVRSDRVPSERRAGNYGDILRMFSEVSLRLFIDVHLTKERAWRVGIVWGSTPSASYRLSKIPIKRRLGLGENSM